MTRCPAGGAACAILLSVTLAAPGSAQIQASERGSVSQTVDGTVITVDYGRPQLRDRGDPFGSVVHWGEMWTPGANWATTFAFSRDVRLNGHEVPAGTYSVWMRPQADAWTVHLNEKSRLFHTQTPAADDHFLMFDVTPRRVEPLEVLTFSFPEVRKDGMLLQLHWGPTAVTFDIAVRPAYPIVALTEADVAPYLGEYTLTIPAGEGMEPAVMDAELLHADDGTLRCSIGGGVYEMMFIPADTPHTFLPALLQNGEIATVEVDAPAIFEVRDGRAERFDLKGELGIWMSGERKD